MDWVAIQGFDYEVSDTGLVRRIGRKVVKQQVKPTGYVSASISRNGKQYTRHVHRIVAKAFLPPPEPGQTQVHHKNGDKADNRPENLEWVTPSQNAKASRRMGQRNANSKLDHATVTILLNEFIHTDATVRDLAKRYAAHCTNGYATVLSVVTRVNWTHVPCDEEALKAAYERKKYKGGGRPPVVDAQQAATIRARSAAGETFRAIAADLGLHETTVSRIANRVGHYATL